MTDITEWERYKDEDKDRYFCRRVCEVLGEYWYEWIDREMLGERRGQLQIWDGWFMLLTACIV